VTPERERKKEREVGKRGGREAVKRSG